MQQNERDIEVATITLRGLYESCTTAERCRHKAALDRDQAQHDADRINKSLGRLKASENALKCELVFLRQGVGDVKDELKTKREELSEVEERLETAKHDLADVEEQLEKHQASLANIMEERAAKDECADTFAEDAAEELPRAHSAHLQLSWTTVKSAHNHECLLHSHTSATSSCLCFRCCFC